MGTLRIAEAIDRFSTQIDEHHDRQASIPVTAGLARQGDVLVVPASMVPSLKPAAAAVPAAGYPVVRGEATANTHLLLADGHVYFDSHSPRDGELRLGTLTVAPGAIAYLAHPEHAFTGILPGTYELRRQREQADEIRMVAD